ncbi:ActS/PrrB/RegB family redox-sensitive histidine kinase [Oricola cellulosilytica]|uniref:histidine kinase n=1 Tax=Oricola cellulosilytica TaxID=1429082 RepID=A0A4R0PFW5_9HYPH|nr:ActS/PrrB/RegB family redox-sensitive histidine kinase [Oricola cellulosilytica]TCD16736.1 ActS/PrrB/RegB family redox-sensitive histidine kinase [Oricola cellulosilytica]
MDFAIGPEAGFGNRRLRLSTLTNTRWMAALGQLLAVLFVGLVLKFELPVIPCVILIAVAVCLNMALTWFYPANQRLRPMGVFAILVFDVAQLAGLLALTGGLTNPFSFLLVVPVIISAATLPPRFTALLALVVIGVATLLMFFRLPLPWYPDTRLDIPLVYVFGLWVAVVSCLVFTAFYVYRVAEEARRLSDALAATELVLQREQHMSALDGLAAAAAHELGTPLATISLVAKEMERASADTEGLKEDIALLRTQADRCREILRRLSTLGTSDGDHISRVPLRALVEEVIAPHREFGIGIVAEVSDQSGPEPVAGRNPGIIYGLGNLVENAVDFAREAVEVNMEWSFDTVSIRITDDGPGFSLEVLEHLGEPDLPVSRVRDRPRRGGGGLGLGIFIAKTLLERSGATLHFSNAFSASGGASVLVTWPRSSMHSLAA